MDMQRLEVQNPVFKHAERVGAAKPSPEKSLKWDCDFKLHAPFRHFLKGTEIGEAGAYASTKAKPSVFVMCVQYSFMNEGEAAYIGCAEWLLDKCAVSLMYLSNAMCGVCMFFFGGGGLLPLQVHCTYIAKMRPVVALPKSSTCSSAP